MILKRHIGFLKVGVLLAALSAALYAAMVFDPATQPPYTVAPYALKSGNLIVGATKAYRPWYENGAWQGDLIEYDIQSDGTRATDALVGSNPASTPGSNWMARATFDSKESSVTDYWKQVTNGRYIFTSTTGTNQVTFLWNNLTSTQRTALDPVTAANTALDTDPYGSPILNYVRGNRLDEKSTPGGTLRIRYNLLGDIINSWPIHLGRPKEQYSIPGFAQFKLTHTARAGRIFVGANDGLLHVFDEADGHEVYAYAPSMLLGKLSSLAATPYNHTYFVDGQLVAASAQVGGTWKSLVTGGLGAGGKGLYALDVTSASASNNKVLFEKTGADFGHIYGSPGIGRKADGTWHIFTGNGYGSTNGISKLLIISVDGTFNVQALTTGSAGGLSAPTLIDVTGNQKVDLVYAGDSVGDLWRFDLRPATPTVTKVFDGSPNQPITSAPAVGPSPNGGFMVYFGTGSVTSLADATAASYPAQAIYGIWDDINTTGTVIVEQTLVELANRTFTSGAVTNTETIRYVSDNDPVDYVCAAQNSSCALGWKVVLPNTGERVLGTPQLRAGRVTVITTNPQGVNGDTDLVGDSWLMSLDYLTGGDGNTVAFNLSGDAYLDGDDKVDIDGNGTLAPPVGVHLADGMISQPRLARLGPGIDIMVINGLRLPLPQIYKGGPFLNGHIDVATDSPNGGSTAPNNVSKHSEGYNVQTKDGLSRAVDGHVHAYDTIHGITHVDMFQLEPRRGLGDLTAIPTPASGGTCPAGSTGVYNSDVPPVLLGCVEKVEGELNRAFDTLTNPALPASEVHETLSLAALNPDKKFIVVLANADLSPGGVLQIGCRTWNVEDYENMITSQLESGVTPANLDDTVNGVTSSETLVFTLNEINDGLSDTADCSSLDEEAGLSTTPTLRIGFDRLAILNQGVHGTRSQCVLGLHDYRDKTCYSDELVLAAAEAALTVGPDPGYSYSACNGFASLPTPPTDYIRDPNRILHITESLEGRNGKYRTRNGALTLQLLNATGFSLQDPGDLPATNQGARFGGTYAQTFTIPNGSNKTPVPSEGANESGLLYEMMVYWHYSALVDGLRNADPSSNSTPQDTSCYGASNYSSALNRELGGLTNGEYQALIADLGDPDDSGSLIAQYSAALDALTSAIASGDEDAINAALLALGALLEANSDLADYHGYRDYAPGHVPEQHLLDLDKDQDGDNNNSGGGSSDDGTPNQVDDLTGFGLSGDGSGGHIGNEVINGLRIWTDLLQ